MKYSRMLLLPKNYSLFVNIISVIEIRNIAVRPDFQGLFTYIIINNIFRHSGHIGNNSNVVFNYLN